MTDHSMVERKVSWSAAKMAASLVVRSAACWVVGMALCWAVLRVAKTALKWAAEKADSRVLSMVGEMAAD